ncbi:MAG: ankyrin repeat domain-containing protein [Brevinema sp.]
MRIVITLILIGYFQSILIASVSPIDNETFVKYTVRYSCTNVTYIDDISKKLFDAVKNGDINLIQQLLSDGVNPNTRDSHYKTPLMYVKNQYLDIAELLLEHGASINTRDTFGNTPLILASEIGYTAFVEWLIKKKAIINIENKEELTALHFAVQNGHDDIVRLLLNNFADINTPYPNNQSLLLVATKFGYKNIVDQLLEKQMNPNEVLPKSQTSLLMIAIILNYRDIAFSLIKAGADINAKNNIQVTPLMAAILTKNYELFDMLLSLNANTQALTIGGTNWSELYIEPDPYIKKIINKYSILE